MQFKNTLISQTVCLYSWTSWRVSSVLTESLNSVYIYGFANEYTLFGSEGYSWLRWCTTTGGCWSRLRTWSPSSRWMLTSPPQHSMATCTGSWRWDLLCYLSHTWQHALGHEGRTLFVTSAILGNMHLVMKVGPSLLPQPCTATCSGSWRYALPLRHQRVQCLVWICMTLRRYQHGEGLESFLFQTHSNVFEFV